jgi:hypothetical protein
MSHASVVLDGKGQYLGLLDIVPTSLGPYNLGNYNDGIYNSPSGNPLGITNTWTLGFWAKPKISKEAGTLVGVGDRHSGNAILIETTPLGVGAITSELRVLIREQDSSILKHYGWGNWFTPNSWTHTSVSWDGSELSASKDAIAKTPTLVLTSNLGGMSDIPSRKIFYGSTESSDLPSFSGTVGHFGMWNTVLTTPELSVVVSGGFDIDLTTSSGAYTSDDSLPHYWKPGEDLSNIGKDFSASGTLLNLNRLSSITGSSVVSDVP